MRAPSFIDWRLSSTRSTSMHSQPTASRRAQLKAPLRRRRPHGGASCERTSTGRRKKRARCGSELNPSRASFSRRLLCGIPMEGIPTRPRQLLDHACATRPPLTRCHMPYRYMLPSSKLPNRILGGVCHTVLTIPSSRQQRRRLNRRLSLRSLTQQPTLGPLSLSTLQTRGCRQMSTRASRLS